MLRFFLPPSSTVLLEFPPLGVDMAVAGVEEEEVTITASPRLSRATTSTRCCPSRWRAEWDSPQGSGSPRC